MNELKFVNKKRTLGELKELFNDGVKYDYQLIKYYPSQYNSVIGEYKRECYFKYPDKDLDLLVINYLVRENLVTILVYGEQQNE